MRLAYASGENGCVHAGRGWSDSTRGRVVTSSRCAPSTARSPVGLGASRGVP